MCRLCLQMCHGMCARHMSVCALAVACIGVCMCRHFRLYIYDLVPKGGHENRTKRVENKVDDTFKLVVFLECAQC